MGHLVFLLLHAAAFLFYLPALVVTIPLHLIYGAVASRDDNDRDDKPTPRTHLKCPDCKEFILKEARVCKHCGCKLIPQP